MSLAGVYNAPMNRRDAVTLLRQAYDHGITFFDTAPLYGMGLSEELVGEALQSVRHKVVIGTKFGQHIDPATQKFIVKDSRPESIKAGVEDSLRRLRTDYVDIYYQHRIDTKVPIEDVAGAVQELIKSGKVRHLGLSEAGAATIRRAHQVETVAAVQNEYSIWSRDPEVEVLQACEDLGIGLVAWSPTGTGFLSGRITPDTTFDNKNDARVTYNFPRFTPEAIRANMPIIDLIRRIGLRAGATPAQVAHAWLLAKKPFVVPIPGTTKLDHFKENIGALDIRLSEADVHEIDGGFASIGVRGLRLPQVVLDDSDTGAVLGTSSREGHGKSLLPGKA